MQQNAITRSARRRRWMFADAVFDEPSWSLTVKGRRIELEGKPLFLPREARMYPKREAIEWRLTMLDR